MYYEVIPAEVFRSGGGILTYSSETPLLPGQIILIPLGRKTVQGIVYRKVKAVDFPTKPIQKILCPFPMPQHLLKTIFWLSQYYLTPIPQVANLLIPAGLSAKNALKGYFQPLEGASSQKCGITALTLETAATEPLRQSKTSQKPTKTSPKSAKTPPESAQLSRKPSDTPTLANTTTSQPLPIISESIKIPSIPLNSAQKQALAEIKSISSPTRLLHGITGSGKTNIYLQLAAETLQNGQSTILLVPEIALTSQLVQIFEQTFGNRVKLIHSGQTMTERRQTWLDIITATSNNAAASCAKVQSQGVAIVDEVQGDTKVQPQDRFCSELVLGGSEARKRTVLQIRRARTGAFDNAIARDKRSQIIIGPRSALLAPIHNLGLIIIDEAHEGAYYQENPPRYSALRLASFIASTCKIPCVLGTATPNIVDYHLAKSKNSLVTLQQKAKNTAIDAKITVIDLKNRDQFLKNRYFSTPILTSIENNLQAKHQTLIFHNRRGSAPLTICEKCGWQALCPTCFLPMTLHTDTYTLECHLCGYNEKVPVNCPECHHPGIIHKGFGTKLLEAELTKLFPNAKIARFDSDNKKSDSLSELYSSVKDGEIDILIGTQTLARGFDLPRLATVGIVQADAGLALPDFATEEHTFELLTQVIGRVGRGHLDTAEVFIQSYQPDHPVIQTAIKSDYAAFSNYLLQHRHAQKMPPFTYLARLSITYKTEKTTITKITQAYKELQTHSSLIVSPPMPAFHERTSRGFTWQIIIKSTSRKALRQALIPYAGNSQYTLVLDPPSLL